MSVRCFGRGSEGQLGQGSVQDRGTTASSVPMYLPAVPMPGTATITSSSAGVDESALVSTTGLLATRAGVTLQAWLCPRFVLDVEARVVTGGAVSASVQSTCAVVMDTSSG